ncbi:MAG: hypothetical protein IJI66_11305 [Erysipelotrichaceae bacterium]|nr:hypothetical protein [Erysipelotrichaceae bacterium]
MEETKTIGKDYTLTQLGLFALPTILNESLISLLYTIDDGLFISRYVGQNALAAFSILSPIFMSNMAMSSLFGGVASLASYKMGEKRSEEARSDFSTMVLLVFVFGTIIAFIERVFLKQILSFLGTTDLIYPYAESFFKIGALYTPLTLVSNVFMRFYVPSGKPKMELFSSMVNVGCNLFFDWYFVVYRGVGMIGAAYANLISTGLLTLIGIFFFSSRHCELPFGKPHARILSLVRDSSKYGISSFLSNLSVAFGNIISNYALLYFGSEKYLASYTIVGNIQWVFMSCYFGLLGTTGPVVSYAMGERNKSKLRKTLQQIFILLSLLTIATVLLFLCFSPMIAELFIAESARDSKDLINYGLSICPYSFIFFGYNVGARMVFASLGNHRISATLTFFQEVLFSNLAVVLLPFLFGIRGVWFSFLLSNVLMFFVTAYAVAINADKYGYGRSGIAELLE